MTSTNTNLIDKVFLYEELDKSESSTFVSNFIAPSVLQIIMFKSTNAAFIHRRWF